MLKHIKRAYAVAPIATVVLAISLFLAVCFTGRVIYDAIDGPPPQNTQIEAWMTPRYIARTWNVPHSVMRELVIMQMVDRRPANLQQIADDRGIPVEDLIAEIQSGLEAFIEARKAERDRK